MALEILRYTMCRVRLGRLVSLPLEVFKLVHILGWKWWTYFYRYVWRQVSPPYCNVFSSFQRENLPSTFSKGDFQKILFWPFLQSCKITTKIVYKGFIEWIAGRARRDAAVLESQLEKRVYFFWMDVSFSYLSFKNWIKSVDDHSSSFSAFSISTRTTAAIPESKYK